MATVEDILVPDIGDFAGVEVIEILVQPGDSIQAEQSLLTLESDKATMEIPAPRAGVVKEIKVKIGDKIGVGDLILTLEGSDARSPSGRRHRRSPAAAPAPSRPQRRQPTRRQPHRLRHRQPLPAAANNPIPIQLPDVGDFHDIPVIEVLVAPGDRLEAEQSFLTLESDKATMEIPVPQAGVVAEVTVKVGDKLNRGDLLMTLIPDAPAQVPGCRRRGPRHRRRGRRAAQGPAPVPNPEPQPGQPGRMPGEKERAPGPHPAAPRGHGRHRHRAHPPRQPGGTPLRPRAGRGPAPGQGQRAQGPHPQGRRPGLRQAGPGPGQCPARRPAPPSSSPPRPRWTSASSARSRRLPSRASSA